MKNIKKLNFNMKNFFFKKKKIKINDILKILIKKKKNNYKINDIKDLESALKMIYLFFIQKNILIY